MDAAKKTSTYTVSEYLRMEQETQTKYEYHNGYIVAMAGGTFNHGVLCGNTLIELSTQLKAKKRACTPFSSELKLHILSTNKYLYPDGMVVCGDIEHSRKETGAIINPILIVEVLSKGTENYDRKEKFDMYREVPSFKEYVLINQDLARVEVYRKTDVGTWSVEWITGIDKTVRFESLEIEVSLESLYENVNFFTGGD